MTIGCGRSVLGLVVTLQTTPEAGDLDSHERISLLAKVQVLAVDSVAIVNSLISWIPWNVCSQRYLGAWRGPGERTNSLDSRTPVSADCFSSRVRSTTGVHGPCRNLTTRLIQCSDVSCRGEALHWKLSALRG